jgi:hypothetical protein
MAHFGVSGHGYTRKVGRPANPDVYVTAYKGSPEQTLLVAVNMGTEPQDVDIVRVQRGSTSSAAVTRCAESEPTSIT